MAETATYPVECVIPRVPVRQWVLSFPIPLRSLFAVHPELLAPVLQIIHRVIRIMKLLTRLGYLIEEEGITYMARTDSIDPDDVLMPLQATTAGAGDCKHVHAHSAPLRMSWTRLLKRVFDIDIERCQACGGKLKIIAVPSTEPVLSLSKDSGQGLKNLR